MADEDKPQFAADPELERAKAWWKDHGRAIVGGAVIGLSAVIGFNYWQHHQETQAETASNLFEQLQYLIQTESEVEADADADATDADATDETETDSETTAAIQATADELMSAYASTPYAIHAAFALAKLAVDGGDLDRGAQALEWVLANSEDDGLLHIARLRLASVLLATGAADDAVALLQSQIGETAGFGTRYNELIGDAYLQKGDTAGARSAYEASVEALPPASAERAVLKLKLDGLGG